jgi:hypothetical protein
VRCERRLVAEARRLNAAGKMLAPIIDDAHLMDVTALRKIRLLFEDFPKNHCLVLVAQPELLQNLALTVNEDLKNRVTYSVLLKKLAPDSIADFIRAELDKAALAHSTFSKTHSASSCAHPKGACVRRETCAWAPCSRPCAIAPRSSSSSRSTASCSSLTGARRSTCRTEPGHTAQPDRPTPSQRLRPPRRRCSFPRGHYTRWLRRRWSRITVSARKSPRISTMSAL